MNKEKKQKAGSILNSKEANSQIKPHLQYEDLDGTSEIADKEMKTICGGSSSPKYNIQQLEQMGKEGELVGRDLSGYNLSGINLAGDNLEGTIFTNDNLSGANLNNANLDNAHLKDTNLEGANLSNAMLADTSLSNAD